MYIYIYIYVERERERERERSYHIQHTSNRGGTVLLTESAPSPWRSGRDDRPPRILSDDVSVSFNVLSMANCLFVHGTFLARQGKSNMIIGLFNEVTNNTLKQTKQTKTT